MKHKYGEAIRKSYFSCDPVKAVCLCVVSFLHSMLSIYYVSKDSSRALLRASQ